MELKGPTYRLPSSLRIRADEIFAVRPALATFTYHLPERLPALLYGGISAAIARASATSASNNVGKVSVSIRWVSLSRSRILRRGSP
jgi:hypothetical protein